MKFRFPIISCLLLSTLPVLRAAESDRPGVEFFEVKIRPVLIAHCYPCHSESARKSGKLKAELLLDSKAGVAKGGDSGTVLIPGKPEESLLLKALQHQDLRMPPKGKLPDVVLADFAAWIKMGAPDPRDGKVVASTRGIDIDQGRRFWAFQLPQVHTRPKVRNENWPRKELDWFILAAQEQRALPPARAATRQEWLRRATLDLVGLPPTPEEIEAFEQDHTPEAFARVVDRLLASPPIMASAGAVTGSTSPATRTTWGVPCRP